MHIYICVWGVTCAQFLLLPFAPLRSGIDAVADSPRLPLPAGRLQRQQLLRSLRMSLGRGSQRRRRDSMTRFVRQEGWDFHHLLWYHRDIHKDIHGDFPIWGIFKYVYTCYIAQQKLGFLHDWTLRNPGSLPKVEVGVLATRQSSPRMHWDSSPH
jgi:hypothetical protein